jgi:hypothetical protein
MYAMGLRLCEMLSHNRGFSIIVEMTTMNESLCVLYEMLSRTGDCHLNISCELDPQGVQPLN